MDRRSMMFRSGKGMMKVRGEFRIAERRWREECRKRGEARRAEKMMGHIHYYTRYETFLFHVHSNALQGC